ncbi:hypothetical protein COY90_05580 [Candidatus Roizmanbacteria bacterium CG_4_10_14_0_8_um_filter_39_9]|uniref:ABC transporter substrate-binding protein n=1 Tax=Candidatus Roizmanbacteria bacterium CG_4_10_14_0_8_um_filter_39_9 TaxID=1974829 RepID=A0A2M7QCM2_9BACT|nr:MAG: hypothetical protein COY90_05580 [Candidatus Roizmanbacteria bacterium CG_4_10_14_0_8_um_filter_39_9]
MDEKTTSEVPTPVFETVPVGETNALQPEELSPEVASPEDASFHTAGPEIAPSDQPLVYQESKVKYIVIGLGVVVFIILLVLFISIFTSKSKNIQKKEVKLVYWGLWEDEQVFAPLIKQYQDSNPGVTITYEKKSPQEYKDKLIVRSQKGQGPDIFRYHNTWLPQIREITAPLPPEIMTNVDFEKTFFPIHQKDLKIGIYYYGLPLEVDGLVLICNMSLLKKAGLNTTPSNWDELIDFAGRVQVTDKEGVIITSGMAMGTASNVEHFSDIYGLMLLLNGGELNKLSQPEAAGALEAYRRFAEQPNEIWSEAMPNSIAAFAQEKVAMIIAPSYDLLAIKAMNPDVKIKVVPIPKPPGGQQVSIASYWVEGVSKMSKNQIEAWKFLKYLTKKEQMTKLYEQESSTRLFGEPYARVDLAPLVVQNEYIGAVVKQASDDVYVSLPLISKTYDAGLNDEISRYIENAINASIQGVSYGEALTTAKKGIDQVLVRYKIE